MAKQVKAHLSDEEAEVLMRVRKRYGFKSDYEFVRAAVVVTAKSLDKMRCDGTIAEELMDIFGELASREEVELGKVPKGKDTMHTDLCFARSAKHYADQFVERWYAYLVGEVAKLPSRPRSSDGQCAGDILNDTIMLLYKTDCVFSNYAEFETWAQAKFKGVADFNCK